MKDEENKTVEESNLKLKRDGKVSIDHPYLTSFTMPWGWGLLILGLLLGSYFYYQQPSKPLPPITHILVDKSRRKMTVYHDNQPIKEYSIALGFQPNGPKRSQGDGKTPEGNYRIVAKNNRSKFHLSLKISYPNAQDAERSMSDSASLGNDIMIHGLGTGLGWIGKLHVLRDWTRGCIAVTNAEIEEIFAATALGTSVEIRP